MIEATPSDPRFPSLGEPVLAELSGFGREQAVEAGTALFRAGESHGTFFVLLDGAVDVRRDDASGELVVSYRDRGQFIGELGLLTEQRTYLTAVATGPGRVLVIPREQFRLLMATKPTISDVIFGALIARRETLRASPAALAIRIWSSKSGERSAATPPKTTLCTAGSTNTFSLGPGCC